MHGLVTVIVVQHPVESGLPAERFGRWFHDLFRLGDRHESEGQAASRRIVGLASALPAITAYLIILTGDGATSWRQLIEGAAGAFTALIGAWVLESRGRGYLMGLTMAGLVGLSVWAHRGTGTGFEWRQELTSAAFVLGALVICLHDFRRHGVIGSFRRPARAAWSADGEVSAVEECTTCDRAVCVPPDEEEVRALRAACGTQTTDHPPVPVPTPRQFRPAIRGAAVGMTLCLAVLGCGAALRRE